MESPIKQVAVDTDVLLCSFYSDAQHHHAALRLIERAENGELKLLLLEQVVSELHMIIQRPRFVSHPFTNHEASTVFLFSYLPGFVEATMPHDLTMRYVDLIKQKPTAPDEAFNQLIVDAMLRVGVRDIFSLNPSAYERFPQINVLTP